MIHFEKVTRDNYRECLRLRVSEDQKHFVANNSISLSKAYVYFESARPLIVYKDDNMIGFILYRNHDELKSYVIDQFMIDEKYQGNGYGKESMHILIEKFRNEKRYEKASLCYLNNDEKAANMYEQLGFIRTGIVDENEVEMELVLNNKK